MSFISLSLRDMELSALSEAYRGTQYSVQNGLAFHVTTDICVCVWEGIEWSEIDVRGQCMDFTLVNGGKTIRIGDEH